MINSKFHLSSLMSHEFSGQKGLIFFDNILQKMDSVICNNRVTCLIKNFYRILREVLLSNRFLNLCTATNAESGSDLTVSVKLSKNGFE